MRPVWVLVSAMLLGVALLLPCAAQDFQGAAAYQELLNRSDPSGIVVLDGRRYVRAPQGVDSLPGGYAGGYKRKTVRLPNGQLVEVIDPAQPLSITKAPKPGAPTTATPPAAAARETPEPAGLPQSHEWTRLSERGRKIVVALLKLGLRLRSVNAPWQEDSSERFGGLIDAVFGDMNRYNLLADLKPGGTYMYVSIRIGSDKYIQRLYNSPGHNEYLSSSQYEEMKNLYGYRAFPMALTPPWTGEIFHIVDVPNRRVSYKKKFTAEISGDYLTEDLYATAMKRDAVILVGVSAADSQSTSQPDDDFLRAVSLRLTAALKPSAENWMKVLTKLIDDVDAGVVPSTIGPLQAAAPTAPAVPARPPVAAVPSIPPAPQSQPQGTQSAASLCLSVYKNYTNSLEERRRIDDMYLKAQTRKKETLRKIERIKQLYDDERCGRKDATQFCPKLEEMLAKANEEMTLADNFVQSVKLQRTEHDHLVSQYAREIQDCERRAEQERNRVLQQLGVTEQDINNIPPDIRDQLLR